jgi:hypothetical protein
MAMHVIVYIHLLFYSTWINNMHCHILLEENVQSKHLANTGLYKSRWKITRKSAGTIRNNAWDITDQKIIDLCKYLLYILIFS